MIFYRALAVAAAIISFVQAFVLLYGYHWEKLSGIWVPGLNAFVALFWMIVLIVGWYEPHL
jgi:hypothetical protein